MILEKINEPNDIKKIDKSQLPELAEEIRKFLIEKVSKKGGHLASNLGVVELTMALHLCLDLPNDKIVWDVGHQSYTHKVLTGRKDGFEELRSYGGMQAAFPWKTGIWSWAAVAAVVLGLFLALLLYIMKRNHTKEVITHE